MKTVEATLITRSGVERSYTPIRGLDPRGAMSIPLGVLDEIAGFDVTHKSFGGDGYALDQIGENIFRSVDSFIVSDGECHRRLTRVIVIDYGEARGAI